MTVLKRHLRNKPSMVLVEDCALKGQAMLIRGQEFGVQTGAASAARPGSIPAACAPTLLIAGLLLLIGP
jgi:hypothetical protein